MRNSPSVLAALKNDTAVKTIPEVIITWSSNRFVGAVASNVIDEEEFGYDIELFPIESITESHRPLKGIAKARIGQGTVANRQYMPPTTVGGTPSRYYIASVDDPYKYWTAPNKSDATGAIANCKPQVIYGNNTQVNKIVIKLENGWASPLDFSIQTTSSATPTDASGWTTVATQETVPAGWKDSGEIVLYYNGSTWTNSSRTDNADGTPKTTTIRGIRLVVTSLEGGYNRYGTNSRSTYVTSSGGQLTTVQTTGANSWFDLIEMDALLEANISENVINLGTSYNLGESNELRPVGTITTNVGSLTLSGLYKSGGTTLPGLFNKNNTNSIYYNLTDSNAEVNTSFKYYDESDTLMDTIKHAKLYTETWSENSEDTTTVSLYDRSKSLNDLKVPAALWERLTVSQIIQRLCDSVGFTDYAIDASGADHVIPVYYVNGESTLWDALNELAEATQTAIYFDGTGTLRAKTRTQAFSPTAASSWTSSSEGHAGSLPDIIELTDTTEFGPNHYTVKYQTTNWSPETNGLQTMQRVWEPEGTTTLRSTPLQANMTASSNTLRLSAAEAKHWPYSATVNIDGEIMRYDGKGFVYYDPNTSAMKSTVVRSAEEYGALNASSPAQHRHKNYFSGGFVVVERGMMNTDPVAHVTDTRVDGVPFTVRKLCNGVRTLNAPGLKHNKSTSRALLYGTKGVNEYRDMVVATHGAVLGNPYYYIGSKFRLLGTGRESSAGIVFNSSGTKEDGYFVQLTPTNKIKPKDPLKRLELMLYGRKNGKDEIIGKARLVVVAGVMYEVDIKFTNNGGNHRIDVWVNGRKYLSKAVQNAAKNAPTGQFGMFMRGYSRAEYEYLYGSTTSQNVIMKDDYSFLDKVKTSYSGQQYKREWVYKLSRVTRRVKKRNRKVTIKTQANYINEFGPYVHELREFDVKFDPAPVMNSRLMSTNTWDSCVIWYNASPFGAKFLVANTARNHAVLSGEDKINGVNNQLLTVYGRALVIKEAEEIVVENEERIRRAGKVESEISSPWIQSKAMAQDIADWVKESFSGGNQRLSLEIFGNPLLELGDVITVKYPDKYIDGEFFITGIETNFDGGLTTSVELFQRK